MFWSEAYTHALTRSICKTIAVIYLFQVCLSLLSGGKWSVWFSFEVASEMICPIRSEELHLLMAAHGICR